MDFLSVREKNTIKERIMISLKLFRYGICVNLKTGRLFYIPYKPQCACESLQLVRHGKTHAIEKKEFMNNYSDNSRLSDMGIKELRDIMQSLSTAFPDVILVGPLKRTIHTYEILSEKMLCEPVVKICDYLIGINNSVWGGKTFEMLNTENLYVFLQRECCHNIFVKTEEGDSWGDVLIRCGKLLKEINKHYADKKILLISQGSIYQGLKILLHKEKKPWDGYMASAMFGIINSSKKQVGYGCIFDIC